MDPQCECTMQQSSYAMISENQAQLSNIRFLEMLLIILVNRTKNQTEKITHHLIILYVLRHPARMTKCQDMFIIPPTYQYKK